MLVLRQGQLIYAASDAVRETLGNVLVSRGAISPEVLAEALQRQQQSERSTRLGSVLQEMGVATRDEIQDVVRSQALGVLKDIIEWQEGEFSFEALDLADEGELPVDLDGFLMEEGLRVDHALLDIAFLGHDTEEQPDSPEVPSQTVSLRDLVAQVSQPAINAELTRALLSFAASFLSRTVLFVFKNHVLEGIAQSGVDHPNADTLVRDLRLDVAQHPFLQHVIAAGHCFSGSVDPPSALGPLASALGEPSTEVVLCPLIVNGEPALLLYGDSNGAAIDDANLLEAVMLQTGMAMEKAILEQRVAELEKKLEERQKEPRQKAVAPPAPPSGGIAESSQRIADLLAGKPSTDY